MIDVQYLQAFEDIDDPQHNHGVSHRVMVDVPVQSVLVILIWPQEQSRNLWITRVKPSTTSLMNTDENYFSIWHMKNIVVNKLLSDFFLRVIHSNNRMCLMKSIAP